MNRSPLVSRRRRMLVEALENRYLLAADFGDAPAVYPVTLADDGARHEAVGPRLGSTRDVEASGIPTADASGDGADEDGLLFGVVRPGQRDATLLVNVQNAPNGALLDGWIDFNRDGNWGGSEDRVFARQFVVEGDNILKFDVPSWAPSGELVGRFRISSSGVSSFSGYANDGEVEDVLIHVQSPVLSTLEFSSPELILGSGNILIRSIDLDRDGDLDFFGRSVSSRGFWAEQTNSGSFVKHDLGYDVVDAADIDLDGDVDFLALGTTSGTSSADRDLGLLINQGDQTFAFENLGLTVSAGRFSDYDGNGEGRIADMDGDGDFDFLMTVRPDSGLNRVHLIEQTSSGWVQHIVSNDVGIVAYDLHAADLDRDGDLDFSFSTYDGPSQGRVGWYRNDGSWNFVEQAWTTGFGQATNAIPLDYDADGDMDVLAGGPSDLGDEIELFQNDGTANFTQIIPQNEITPYTYGVNTVFPADLSGNGQYDIVWGDWWGRSVGWIPHSTSSPFSVQTLHTFGTAGNFIWADDLQDDGSLDLLISNRHANGNQGAVYWIANEGLVTLDNIDDMSMQETLQVDLTGISSNRNGGATMRIIATSSNPGLIADPIVQYDSPDSVGTLSLTRTGFQAGVALITVTVEDAGPDGDINTGADNVTFQRDFAVSVEQQIPNFVEVDDRLELRLLDANQTVQAQALPNGYQMELLNGVWIGNDSTNVIGHGTTTLTVTSSGRDFFNALQVDDYASGGAVEFLDSGAHSYSDSWLIDLDDPSAGGISFAGKTQLVGNASLEALTSHQILVSGTNTVVSTVDGQLKLWANQQTVIRSDVTQAISILDAAVTVSGSGDLDLRGRSGGIAGNSGSYLYGVQVVNGTVSGGGAGSSTLVLGQGGMGTGNYNHGVLLWDRLTGGQRPVITSKGGNVSLVGYGGGSGDSLGNRGVSVSRGALISAGGEGDVSLLGSGGSGSGGNHYGVIVEGIGSGGSRSTITSSGGGVTVVGQGGESDAAESFFNQGVNVSNGGLITSVGAGTVSVRGVGGAGDGNYKTLTGTSANQHHGVSVIGVSASGLRSSITSAGGDVFVTGTGGGIGGAGYDVGVHVAAGALLSAGDSGLVSVQGTGGNGSGDEHYGVWVGASSSGHRATITSSGGNVVITGQGGGVDAARFNDGVRLWDRGLITAGELGAVTVTGQGGFTPGGRSNGVGVFDRGTIESSGGNITVFGAGGSLATSASFLNRGVELRSGGTITSGGAGQVTVTGTGGASLGGYNYGVVVAGIGSDGSRSTITSSGGAINVIGTGGGKELSLSNSGVRVAGGGLIDGPSSASLTVRGTGGSSLGGDNTGVLVTGSSSGVRSTIGSGGGDVLINGTALPNSGSSHGIAVQSSGLLHSGGDLTLLGDENNGTQSRGLFVGDSDTEIQADRKILIDASIGVDQVTTDFSAAQIDWRTGTWLAKIEGLNAETDYDQIDVEGSVELGTLVLSGEYQFPTGGSIILIDNDGTDPIAGTLPGLSEGDYLTFNHVTLQVSYVGGDGNDLELTAVNLSPELDSIASLSIAEDASTQIVNLTGIAAGGDETQPLRVTATSSDPSLIPDPAVTYSSPNTTGSLAFTPIADQHGMATIVVTVEDGGLDGDLQTPEDNAFHERVFTVTILNTVDLSGHVFDDRGNDGLLEIGDGDVGLEGQRIVLLNQADQVVGSTLTDANGGYEFDFGALGLAPGTYQVQQIEQPLGFLDGKESIGDLADADSTDDGIIDNSQDSNLIAGIVITAAGTQSDAAGYNFAELLPASLQGLIWEDFDNDGTPDLTELAIDGATVTLTGVDDRGAMVTISQVTDAEGIYEYADLRPGTYSIQETQPTSLAGEATSFLDGQESLGELHHVSPEVVLGESGQLGTNDAFIDIDLVAGASGVNYNFGERLNGGTFPTAGVTATIGFWQNKNGQGLIYQLNGTPDSTLLGEYLTGTFPNLYGGGVLDRNGDTMVDNREVAESFKLLFKRNRNHSPAGPPKLDAQVMAVALATYVTRESLVSLDYATQADSASLTEDIASYGFAVTTGGVGSTTVNVGDAGEALGYSNDSEVQIIDLLLANNARSVDGLLFDDLDGDGQGDGEIDATEELYRTLANDLFSAINQNGHI